MSRSAVIDAWVLGVAACLVGCSSSDGTAPGDAAIDAPLDGRDAPDDAPIACLSSDECPMGEVCTDQRCAVFRCAAGTTDCRMGLIARCGDDGSAISYESCPVGKVCLDGGCVANHGKVYFVTGAPPSVQMLRPANVNGGCTCSADRTAPACALATELEARVPAEVLEKPPGWPQRFYGDGILFQRFAIRRILEAIGDDANLQFALLHKPSVVGTPASVPYGEAFQRWISAYRVAPESYFPEIEESSWVGQMPGFRDWYRPIQNQIFDSSAEPLGWIPCIDPYFDASSSWFDPRLVLAVPPWGTSADVFPWVDEILETRDLDASCNPGVCRTGFCLAGRCVEVTNPEIPGRLFDADGNMAGIPDRSPMLLYAANIIHRLGRMQGVSCRSDVDCPDADYRCVEGRCDDPARFCRRHHVVHFEQRDCLPNEFILGPEGVAPLQSNWMAAWLSEGLWKPCNTNLGCPDDAWSCASFRPYWGYDPHPESAPRVCVPDFLVTSGAAAGTVDGGQCADIHPFRLTTPYLVDRQGDRIAVVLHEIDQLNPSDGWLAVYGGGQSAVFGYECGDPAWEDGIERITRAITEDVEDRACTPDDVPARFLPGYRPMASRRFDWSPVDRGTCISPAGNPN